jgi:AhpD family alkylhydroperoxidase
MQTRMDNPAIVLPEAMPALLALGETTNEGGVPPKTLELVHLRVSQINGCAVCIDGGVRRARKAGETDERLSTVAAWRDAPYFSDDERAALALAEEATRLADRPDPVPDVVWAEAARHYDEPAPAALVLMIALPNVWNRLNVVTRQVAGAWAG